MNTATANKHTLITAAEWFGGGRRVPYDPNHYRMLTSQDNLTAPHLMVFERVVGVGGASDATGRWITMLPGYPDGSYGYAKVNALLGDEEVPRLYLEYVGQGDSDKPRDYAYSTTERADLVEAQWQAHGVRRTFVVNFDYSSLVVLELLARQQERLSRGEPLTTRIESVFIGNGDCLPTRILIPGERRPCSGRHSARSVCSVRSAPRRSSKLSCATPKCMPLSME